MCFKQPTDVHAMILTQVRLLANVQICRDVAFEKESTYTYVILKMQIVYRKHYLTTYHAIH